MDRVMGEFAKVGWDPLGVKLGCVLCWEHATSRLRDLRDTMSGFVMPWTGGGGEGPGGSDGGRGGGAGGVGGADGEEGGMGKASYEYVDEHLCEYSV